ncbi:MAG: SDR family NAD(P)-dependent oxidoreductase [Actinobacteria bacterium]|nr:SDR family NAD(P)-dependent oxidoreductase [Actinomycetota bacterium]
MTAGRVAIVAGAGGAGEAAALALAAESFHVVILDSRLESAQAAADTVTAGGRSAEAHGIDLLDVTAVVALHDDVVARLGRADVVVHLVGGWRGSPGLGLTSVDNWNALHPPVVGTLASLTAVFGPTVKSAEAGRIFMVTSTAAATPTAGNIAYAAAKRAAEAWMEGVADYFRGTASASVTVAVKALLTDRMVAADPEKSWPGYTHVRDLASAIAHAATTPIDNGTRLDLTTGTASA